MRRRAACGEMRAGDESKVEMLMPRWRGGVMMCRGLRALGARTLSDEACALGRSAQDGGRRKAQPHTTAMLQAQWRARELTRAQMGTTRLLEAWVRRCLHSLQEVAERGWLPPPSLLVS